MSELRVQRDNLNKMISSDKWADVKGNWPNIRPLIQNWWSAYRNWEKTDTFGKAFKAKRMSVRTFPAGFDTQKSKSFDRGTIKVPSGRFMADSQYTALGQDQQGQHHANYHDSDEKMKYHAQRGIDSSSFENPANFVSRLKKYEEGLHDLSASILNPDLSIFDQVHNSEEGAHYSFLPLSNEEDQELLYTLQQSAKGLRVIFPEFYTLIRGYRSKMTRVKVAQEFDMGVGFTFVPTPDSGTGLNYKLRYGLGNKMTVTGVTMPQTVTKERYIARQKAAHKFKSIIGIRDAKNEIVIAIRKHKGNFPVYAVRKGNELRCFDIVGGTLTLNGKKISSNGVMT